MITTAGSIEESIVAFTAGDKDGRRRDAMLKAVALGKPLGDPEEPGGGGQDPRRGEEPGPGRDTDGMGAKPAEDDNPLSAFIP